jgi:hypothetical protein
MRSILQAMNAPEHLTLLSRDALVALVAEQQRQIAELTARLEALHAEVECLTWSAKRQAAPFSKGGSVNAIPQCWGEHPTRNYRSSPVAGFFLLSSSPRLAVL